jgi:hypothetical protein
MGSERGSGLANARRSSRRRIDGLSGSRSPAAPAKVWGRPEATDAEIEPRLVHDSLLWPNARVQLQGNLIRAARIARRKP